MCNKRKFYRKIDAKIALASTQKSKASKREECRVYWCPECKAHHLTSKPKAW